MSIVKDNIAELKAIREGLRNGTLELKMAAERHNGVGKVTSTLKMVVAAYAINKKSVPLEEFKL